MIGPGRVKPARFFLANRSPSDTSGPNLASCVYEFPKRKKPFGDAAAERHGSWHDRRRYRLDPPSFKQLESGEAIVGNRYAMSVNFTIPSQWRTI